MTFSLHRLRALPLWILLMAGGAFACAAAPERAANAYLSQADAEARSARVSKVDYVLDMALSGKPTFSGTSTITFDLNDASTPLTIDLDKAKITSLLVNGKAVKPRYNQWFITLSPDQLRQGRNSVAVSFERAHSTNGEGLHRMVDPADGKVYTYSQFEPAGANQMFALFDQPDLKASFTLSVTAPANWQVVSAMRESAVQVLGTGSNAKRRWTFPATPRLSAYTFSLHAGPYKVWEDNSGKYPLRLFARQSVASQVAPADWFKYTKSGLAYFETYFGIPYPFAKYDQLLVPDFLYGAMENVGAVTFAEDYFLTTTSMSDSQREYLALVIMHEMAHQWFGDLVTMKWWNGLWLNESFAEFMGVLATAESTEFTGAWQTFYSREKQGAYIKDQSRGTHAIDSPVLSTANASDNSDDITYAKGASALKQLRHLLGEEVFRKGVHDYLVKHAYGNARLVDFTDSLGQAAGRDLTEWTEQWFKQAGVNTITADLACANGLVTRFSIEQRAPNPDLPILREQRVQVAAFSADDGQLTLSKKIALTYKGASTPVPEMLGTSCPDLVYPNYEDWGYARVQLDQRSFATAQRSVGKVSDPMLRSMLWQSLWDGVQEGHLPLDQFITAVQLNAPLETDPALLGSVFEKLLRGRGWLNNMAPDSAYARQTARAIEVMAWTGIMASKGQRELEGKWFSLYLNAAHSPEALARLGEMLANRLNIGGMHAHQDMRWHIIIQLNRHAAPGSAALVKAELKRDPSDAGQLAALQAMAMRPDPRLKAQWLAEIWNIKNKMPFSRIRTLMENLYPAGQANLSEASADARIRHLLAIDQKADLPYQQTYGMYMLDGSCSASSVARLASALENNPGLSPMATTALGDALEADQRCVRVGAAMAARLR
jgi:aminopeptidase N